MNKYYFLLLLVVSLKAEQEVPPVRVIHQSELREKLKPWNWNTQQKKLKPKYTPFKGLIGSFHPYLFYLRDTMQNENKRGVYEYQRTDEEASSKRFEQRHAIETFIEKRESFQREVGARIVLPEAYQDDDLGNNGILLVGASGTGKTTAVQCLARESGCKIIEVKPTGSYVAEGQEIIYKSLLDALQIATETGRRVILYFDECQVFTHESKNGRYDDPTARTLLWQMLDKYKLDPRILFVASTHKETGLDHAFQRRWRLIRFDKPSKEERVECLKTNAKKNGLDLMPETIETIAKMSNVTYAHIESVLEEVGTDVQCGALEANESTNTLNLDLVKRFRQRIKAGQNPSEVSSWQEKMKDINTGTEAAKNGTIIVGGLCTVAVTVGTAGRAFYNGFASQKESAAGQSVSTVIEDKAPRLLDLINDKRRQAELLAKLVQAS